MFEKYYCGSDLLKLPTFLTGHLSAENCYARYHFVETLDKDT